jgi:hypothetical protein
MACDADLTASADDDDWFRVGFALISRRMEDDVDRSIRLSQPVSKRERLPRPTCLPAVRCALEHSRVTR